MAWWRRLLRRSGQAARDGTEFRVAFVLYSEDGKRAAEVREFSNGQTYLLETERVERTTFEARHAGRMVGPFKTPAHAERFIVATPWFKGQSPEVR